jgi:addiction module HigA family antidote
MTDRNIGERPVRKPPVHPGQTIRRTCLEPHRLTVTEAAKGLGVTRKALSELLNGKSGVSAEMAVRLSKAFGTTPEHWLQKQLKYDLWKAEQTLADASVRPLTKSDVWS